MGDAKMDENEQERVDEIGELLLRSRIQEIFLTVPDDEMYNEVLRVFLEALDSKYGVFGFIDENGALVVPSMTRHLWDQCQVPERSPCNSGCG